MKTYYLHFMIQNHSSVTGRPQHHPTHNPFISSPSTKNVTSLHSAEGFLKSFVQQTAFKKMPVMWNGCWIFFYISLQAMTIFRKNTGGWFLQKQNFF